MLVKKIDRETLDFNNVVEDILLKHDCKFCTWDEESYHVEVGDEVLKITVKIQKSEELPTHRITKLGVDSNEC